MTFLIAVLLAAVAACPLLSGVWSSQHGATLNLRAIAKTGELTGDYVDANKGAYALYGTFQVGACQPTLGFAVTWSNAAVRGNSTTAWSGALINNTITALWWRVDNAGNSDLGADVFTPN